MSYSVHPLGLEPRTYSTGDTQVGAEVASANEVSTGTDGAQQPNRARSVAARGDEGATDFPATECDHWCPQWHYQLDTSEPRAYSFCRLCRHYVVVLLPRQDGNWVIGWSPESDAMTPEMRSRALVVRGLEATLKGRGVSAWRHRYFDTPAMLIPAMLVDKLREQAEDHAEDRVHKRERRVEAEERALGERQFKVWTELGRLEDRIRAAKKRLRRIGVRVVDAERRRGRPVLAVTAGAPAYVYALVSTRDTEFYAYVGSTENPHQRLTAHASGKGHPKVRAWIEQETRAGYLVQMVELWSGVDREEAYRVEQQMIADMVSLGMATLNTVVPKRGAA